VVERIERLAEEQVEAVLQAQKKPLTGELQAPDHFAAFLRALQLRVPG
jgi:uncharacterized protein (UPF0335 family)